MIRSFKHKGLAELWADGRTAKIDARLQARAIRRLDALDSAGRPEDLDLPGFDFHALRGFVPTRYALHVNGPWRITFAFEGGDAFAVDFENHH